MFEALIELLVKLFLKLLRDSRAGPIIVKATPALVLFFVDPLGVVAYQQRVIDNSIAVLFQFSHKSESGKELAVVLIDQEALDAWRVDWPITYRRTAGLIHALACARAIGVFFDFTLSEKFNLAEGESDLQAVVLDPAKGACADGNPPAAIKVFFGKADNIESPLAQSLDRDSRAFSIDDGADDSVYPAASVEFPDAPVPIAQATPAFGVIRSVPQLWPQKEGDAARPCGTPDPRPKCWIEPLAIQWSAKLDPDQGAVSDIHCRGFPGWFDIVASSLGMPTARRFEACPPILTLKAQDLFRDREYIADHGNPADLIRNRFVFVGTDLAGLNDEVFSPVHGYLPGVYKHAVATDNLLSYVKDRGDYPTVPRPWLLGTLVVITYFVIEAVREWSPGPKANAAIVAMFGLALLFWIFWIYWWNWSLSLLFAVFGYYATGVLIVIAAKYLSPTTMPQPRAPLDKK